ncbi:MAG: metallophosphoesterase [Planctomycetes bacterium]|nr:metallophosphoesterase [Planctomycetota bacterium]
MNEALTITNRSQFRIERLLKRLVWTVTSSVSLCGLYRWKLDDSMLLIERRKMPIEGLGSGFAGVKIAHITDLHLGPAVLESYLRQHVEIINAEGVDFVAITGDLITGGKDMARKVAGILKHLKPKVATMAAMGNHDYGLWHPKGIGAMPRLGQYLIGCLADKGILATPNACHTFSRNGSAVQFLTMDEIWWPGYNPQAAFEQADGSRPIIAMVHNPDAAVDMATRGAQWILAGHTHGVPTPKTRFHRLVFPADYPEFYAGYYPLGGGSHLYVNRGLGHSCRWNRNQKPEITIFTLAEA